MMAITKMATLANFPDLTRSPVSEALLAGPLACSASPLKWSQPEQTGTADVVVLKELRPILFRVPVLLALFDERL